MGHELRFHHIGVATGDLDAEARRLAALGYAPEGADFDDPLLGIRGRFLAGPGPRLELVAPRPGSDVLVSYMGRGIKLYHLAFETPDLAAAIARQCEAGARVVVPPTPAVAFGGRPVCFVMLPSMLLVELIGAS